MEFKEFIESDPRYKKYKNNTTVKLLFDFMSKPESIDKMIISNNEGKPALKGILPEVESEFNNSSEFNIEKDYFPRQFIGAMVREIIKEFGYIVDRAELNRQKNINGKYIKSATHYKFVPKFAKKMIKKVIVDI